MAAGMRNTQTLIGALMGAFGLAISGCGTDVTGDGGSGDGRDPAIGYVERHIFDGCEVAVSDGYAVRTNDGHREQLPPDSSRKPLPE